MTEEQQKLLIEKFDNDVKYIPYWFRLLIAIDQFLNVLILNGSHDETISSNIGRKIANKTNTKGELILCKILRLLQNKHCKKNIGE